MIYIKPNEMVDLSDQIEQMRVAEEKEIAQKFKELISSLPSHLTQWNLWFKPMFLNKSWRDHLKQQVCVQNSWDVSEPLLKYSLTPLVIYSSIRGIELLFSKYFYDNSQIVPDGSDIIFNIEVSGKKIPISFDRFAFSMDLTQTPQENRQALAKWLLEIIKIKPDLIPNFLINNQNGELLVKEHKVEKVSQAENQYTVISEGYTTQTSYPPKIIINESYYYKEPSKLKEFYQEYIVVFFLLMQFLLILITIPFLLIYSKSRYSLEKLWWENTQK